MQNKPNIIQQNKYDSQLNQMCRCCMASGGNMKHLFQDGLNEDFSRFSNLEVLSSDSLPMWLCWQCCVLLQKCILFKNICNQSVYLLYKYNYKDMNNQEKEIFLENKRTKLQRSTLSISIISHTDYLPNENLTETNSGKHGFEPLNSKIFQERVLDDSRIKSELTEGFDTWYEDRCKDFVSKEAFQIKNEIDYQFSESDDEPVIKKKKVIEKTKKHTTKINNIDNNHKSKLLSNNRRTVFNTPAKYFDYSMVSITSLDEGQQMTELENARHIEDYIKSPYKCKLCARGFAHELVYKEHSLKHEPISGPHVCSLCTQRFNTARNLSNHIDTHSTRYTCKLCGKVLISKQNIMSHIYTEHDQTDKQIKCELCLKTYKNRYTYTKHMRIHNSSKQYKCDMCPKVFLWKDNLNRHLTRHKSDRQFSCPDCPKSFFLKENLKNHQLVHSAAKRFYCVECDLSYASQVKLNQHLKRGTRHLRPEQLTFSCTLCDARYTNSLQLSTHIDRVHLKRRTHICPSCPAAFICKKTLYTHVRRIHEGHRKPKDHMCDACGKGFSDKQVLKAHLRTHTGEKPYSCKYCEARFGHSGAMYTHIKLVHLKLKRNIGISKKSTDLTGGSDNCLVAND